MKVDGSETATVRVSWEAVEGADYYTVLFSAAVGDDQEGLCRDEPLSASDTVNGSTNDLLMNVSIAVEEDVGSNETSYLRAYTTYSVTVAAFSDVWGRTVGSEPIIRASVDALCRDGTSEISRDPRTKRLQTRRESLARPLKYTNNNF